MAAYKYKSQKGTQWYYSFMIQGRRYLKRGFATKNEAQKAEYEARESLRGGSSKVKKISFKEAYDAFIAEQERIKKASTARTYRLRCNKHLQSRFENCDNIFKITNNDFLQWRNQKWDVKSPTINKAIGMINCFIRFLNDTYGTALKILKSFINDHVPLLPEIWDNDEFECFISVVDDELWALFFETLFFTGMRLGEILALTWGGFNYNKKEISVRGTITNKNGNGRWEHSSPKTRESVRTILITDGLATRLNKYRTDESYFIFSRDGTKPFSPTHVERLKNRYCRLANVKQIKIHEFRHSHASMLINAGVVPTIVAKRLGHASPAITLSTYSHMYSDAQESILPLLERKIPIKR